MKLMIPINEVLISETHAPPGWLVGAYDADGFIHKPAWFPPNDLSGAKDYAGKIAVPIPNLTKENA